MSDTNPPAPRKRPAGTAMSFYATIGGVVMLGQLAWSVWQGEPVDIEGAQAAGEEAERLLGEAATAVVAVLSFAVARLLRVLGRDELTLFGHTISRPGGG